MSHFNFITSLIFSNKRPRLVKFTIKLCLLWITILIFYIAIIFWILYDGTTAKYQLIFWFPMLAILGPIAFGIDGISLFFIILTTFIIPSCFLSNISLKNSEGFLDYTVCLIIVEIFLILAFCALDLLTFYICFEILLIPMLFIIGIWGSRTNKIKASYYFLIYTLIGSLLLLWAILIIYSEIGSVHNWALFFNKIHFKKQVIIWLNFFIAFSVKIPIYPFHLWLTQAHIEAPTVGSVILASLLLKLGGYGFIRFLIPTLPLASKFYSNFVLTLCIISILYASICTLFQIDLKKIIAYSSIAHMNLIVAGIFSFNIYGLQGSILLMLSHGITSGALFFLIGVLYDRYHSRLIRNYGGITQIMPLFSFFFFFFNLANMGFPGSFNFIGEILIFVALFKMHPIFAIFASCSIVLSAVYSLWIFNRVAFGTLRIAILELCDLSRREFYLFIPYTIITILFGICPNILLDSIHISTKVMLLHLKNNTYSY